MHLKGIVPSVDGALFFGFSLRRGRKEHLLNPWCVCQALCGMLYMYQMESKLPPTVTYPLFYVPPEKQNHYQLIEGCHPGCIYCEAKET